MSGPAAPLGPATPLGGPLGPATPLGGPLGPATPLGPWHAVDGDGRDLATGRPPRSPGWRSPAAALAAAPVAAWPLGAVDGMGGHTGLAAALGPGGDRVERLLAGLVEPAEVDVEALASATPAGTVALPIDVVGLRAGIAAEPELDRAWLAEVDRRRGSARAALVSAGRTEDLEAALHVAIVLATERFDPADDTDVDAHVASGARLWLLTGAVASALAGMEPDPFAAWARLVVGGWWPVGPCGGRLVVSRAQP